VKSERIKTGSVVFVIVLLICCSMACFFSKKEHMIADVWYEESMVLTPHGFKEEKSDTNSRKVKYIAGADAGSYIDISATRSAFQGYTLDSVIARFQAVSKRDEDVRLAVLDEEGKEAAVYETTWEEGEIYFLFDMEDQDENVSKLLSEDTVNLRLYVNQDMDTPMIYTATGDSSSKLRYMALAVSPVIAFIAALMFIFIKPLNRFINGLREMISEILLTIRSSKRKIIKFILELFICIVISAVGAFILSRITGKSFTFPLFTLCLMPVVFIYMAYVKRSYFKDRIHVFGALFVLVIGTVFSFAAPACSGLNFDDQDHYSNVVYMATCLERKVSLSDWDNITEAGSAMVSTSLFENETKKALVRFRNDMSRMHYYVGTSKGLGILKAKNLSYITSLIPYFIAKLFRLPWSMRFMIGRWGTVLFLAIVTYISMKCLKSGKIIAMAVAAMPGVMFLAASYSYDIWLLGCILLGLAMFFGEKQDPANTLKLKKALAIAIILAVSNCSKPVYFPLFMVAFFMPKEKFKERKNYWLYKLLIIGAMLVPILIVVLGTLMPGVGQGDTRGGGDVNATEQLNGFLSEPLRGMLVIGNFLSTYLNPFFEKTSWFNRMGYLGSLNIGIYGAVVLTIAAFIAVNRKEEGKFPWWYRLGVLAVYCVIGFMVSFSMYIAFTPVGADTVNGCQARYILPAVFPVLFACTRWSAGALLDRVPKLDNICKKEFMGCPVTYIRDVLIALFILIPNMMGVYLYMVK